MRAVIQRVFGAELIANGKPYSKIGKGLVVFLGVSREDDEATAEKFAKKIAALRIFSDENDKMNLSVQDIGGEILLVSNFTVCGDTSHGNRPNFSGAKQKSDGAEELFKTFVSEIAATGVPVKTGVFGADMTVNQQNDGPVTVIYEL